MVGIKGSTVRVVSISLPFTIPTDPKQGPAGQDLMLEIRLAYNVIVCRTTLYILKAVVQTTI